MQHTSDNHEGASRPFFSPEQIYAFQQPPSDAAVNQVKKQGSDQDYLPGEYIRLLLNRYLGAGMYDLDVQLAGGLHIETVKKDKWENRQKVGQIENVAVTANVSVTIVIYAADGSGRTRKYSAVGSHTMYGLAEAGAGAIIGNAIKSAETSGLKRAVQPLGRAFGLDLKNKVTAAMMPPGIQHFRRLLEEHKKEGEQRLLTSSSDVAVEPTPSQNGREEREAIEPTEKTNETVNSDQNKQGVKSPAKAEPEVQQAKVADSGANKGSGENRKSTDSAPETTATNKVDEKPQAEADQAKAQASEEDWELSMTPTNYEQWMMCIKTMTRRVGAMTSERELVSFARRNSALIKALPVYPADKDQPAKDFATRWKTVMGRRYQSLNLEVPAEYHAEKMPQNA